ncbi:MAG: hypothetical protein PHI97_12785 [Desulfobulbus sp.]|nr:hypothetical protein [Desulfobulbus sp.]
MANCVLIVTGDAGDTGVLKTVFSNAKEGEFVVEWVGRLSEGLKRLLAGGIDLVVVDLHYPTARGLPLSISCLPLCRTRRS